MKIALKSIMNHYQLLKVIDSCDIVYLGHETCPHKFETADELKEMITLIKEKKKELYYGIPVIQESNLDKAKRQINTVMEFYKNCTFVVNDMGILYYLGRQYSSAGFKIFLGRLLNKTIVSCPWYNHIIRNENAYIQNAMFTNSANLQVLMDYLKQFKVCGIEANIISNQTDSLVSLKKNNYELAMNYDYIYVTSSRFCPAACYHKMPVPSCRYSCDAPVDIELTGIKDVFDLKGTYFLNEESRTLYGKMKVFGNLVVTANTVRKSDILPDLYDVIIFDLREYRDKESVLINKTKEILSDK